MIYFPTFLDLWDKSYFFLVLISNLTLLWPASVFYVFLFILSTLKTYFMCRYDLGAMLHINLEVCILLLHAQEV